MLWANGSDPTSKKPILYLIFIGISQPGHETGEPRHSTMLALFNSGPPLTPSKDKWLQMIEGWIDGWMRFICLFVPLNTNKIEGV